MENEFNLSYFIQKMEQENARNLFEKIAGKNDYSSLVKKVNYLIFSRNFNAACHYCRLILDVVPLEKIKAGVFINFLRAFYFAGREDDVRGYLEKKILVSNDEDKLLILSSLVELGHRDVSGLIELAGVNINNCSKFFMDRAPLTNSCDALGSRDGKFLFVSGTPRSGTSAFGTLLNSSDDVALAVERYGYTQGYHPGMFDASNLFYSKEYVRKYESLYRKIGNAKYVGDKRPNFLFSWEITKQYFSPDNIKIIHFIRSPYLVAESYHKRAEKQASGGDAWSSNAIAPRDEFYACHDINLNNRLCLELLKDERYRDSVLVVDSDKFYKKMNNVREVFDWLNLRFDKRIEESAKKMLNKSKRLSSSSVVSKEIASAVDRYLDFKAQEDVFHYSFC